MSARAMAIPDDTQAKQRRASHPQHSVWVSANAGSGKTHVLTQRVVRLLLGGVAPSRILCLTFTKAAAANMSIRVFHTLAGWTGLDDGALAEAIQKTGAPPPSATDLELARKLFARTVETPGGLKIQTIHAFCERLLHLFPFEANVAARFSVLDDLMHADLLARARLETLQDAVGDGASPLGQALARLGAEMSDEGFSTLLTEALKHRSALRDAAEAGWRDRLAASLGLGAGETVATIERAMLEGGLPRAEWGTVARALGADGTKNTPANRLAKAALAAPDAALDAYLDVYLTATLEPRADSYLSQSTRTAEPKLCAQLDAEKARLVGLLGRRRAAQTFARTGDLALLGSAVLDRYEAAKRARGLLDFDDLVERTGTLLQRAGAAWVLYKLDSGIDHVLVDEAQDTSPPQWDILQAITAEFFAGAGQARAQRTFFAVGDEKQSIFSFQGARPAMFDAMREAFEAASRRGAAAFERVPLTLSFRSTRPILETVDRVFAVPEHARGLTASEPLLGHEPLRRNALGSVELWPLVGPTVEPAPKDWRLPVDQVDSQAPAVVLARRIADTIAGLTGPASTETVEDRDTGGRRPIRPGDIMILVRARNVFFDAMIRALKDRQVPVAGADRILLTDHIAVMDLIAAGRAALLPEDDLTLACVLKSPLIGLDDDDLIALAPERRGSLAEALDKSAVPAHRQAAQRLQDWRHRAARLTPFAFYARLLGADGGRRAMLARLGPEAGDALDEFLALTLAHERDGAPSLVKFLAGIEGQDLSIKRDMEAAGDAVRVMTVHAAKGLEAKIVFLPDTCAAPSGRHDPKLFALGSAAGDTLAWSPRTGDDAPAVTVARAALRQAAVEEHNRLLYVALTRAEERLYVAGFHGPKGPASGCWYAMIEASELGLEEAPAPWDAAETIRLRRDAGLSQPAEAVVSRGDETSAIPDWLTRAPPAEIVYAPPVKPSNALGAADQQPLEPEGFVATNRDAARRSAALVGRLAHHLLQHLPDVAAADRQAAALRYLASQGATLDPERRTRLAGDIVGIVDHPRLAPLFGPAGRAEVGIAGPVMLDDGRTIQVAGQIDRIGIGDTAVLIADFKTGRPHTLDSVPAAYVAQMALYRAAVAPLYPGRTVEAVLIWTSGPTILELPEERLAAALGELAAG